MKTKINYGTWVNMYKIHVFCALYLTQLRPFRFTKVDNIRPKLFPLIIMYLVLCSLDGGEVSY